MLPFEGRMGMGLSMELAMHQKRQQQLLMLQELRQIQPYELWRSLGKQKDWGYRDTIDAWFEGIRPQIADSLITTANGEIQEGVPIFVIGVGEPRSGKTKMLHDFAVQTIVGRHPSDTHSLTNVYSDYEDVEILCSTDDWGANFPDLPMRVPEEVDYNGIKSEMPPEQLEALKHWKRAELQIAAMKWGVTFEEIIKRYYHRQDLPRRYRRNSHVAHMVLCDHPGPTGIPPDIGFDRGTEVLRNLIHHEGQFKDLRYGVILFGLVATAEVLRHNEAKRIAIKRKRGGKQLVQDLRKGGDTVIGVDDQEAAATAKLYAEEAASALELEQFLYDSEQYQIHRLEQLGYNGRARVARYRESLEERQEDMASIILPDYLENGLGVDPEKVLLLRNSKIIPQTSLTSIAKHRPTKELQKAGVLQERIPALRAA